MDNYQFLKQEDESAIICRVLTFETELEISKFSLLVFKFSALLSIMMTVQAMHSYVNKIYNEHTIFYAVLRKLLNLNFGMNNFIVFSYVMRCISHIKIICPQEKLSNAM